MATAIRLDPATEQRLDHLASTTGRSEAYCLREPISNGLHDLEDFYLAHAVMGRVPSGQEQTFTLDGVARDLGVAD